MKKLVLIIIVLVSVSLMACQTSNCQEIDDEMETNPNWIGSASVERSNLGQKWDSKYYWRNDFELFLDFNNKKIGMGNGPTLPSSNFYSDVNHQWYICEKPIGFLYATLGRIND
jgi:hypothetical protein